MAHEIILTRDGSHSILHQTFDVTYHSIHGAIQETQHVFINSAFRLKAIVQEDISILEIGFGTGLNAMMTYLEAKRLDKKVDYCAIEAYPLTMETIRSLNYCEEMACLEEQKSFEQLHRLPWETTQQLDHNFSFKKLKQQIESVAFDNQFDIIYFDAFAPNAQPELWELSVFKHMFESLKPGGVLVTYCAKGVVKRTMKAAGFIIEAIPGPPGKREMTRAIKPSPWL